MIKILKITDIYGKYKITLSSGIRGDRGVSVEAKDRKEMINVVKHYYSMKHNKRECPNCKEL